MNPIKFYKAGNATFTVRSKATGARYTFNVKRAKDRQGSPMSMYFVAVLSGPDNTSNYTYMGIIDKHDRFILTRKSKVKEDAVSFKTFSWLHACWKAQHMPANIEVYHEGKCGRCGRKLTVPESIESGFGPECANYV